MTARSHQAKVEVPGGRLWAEWAGEGTGVVLAHAGIADARMWDPQWEALAARHRVVRYDLRGFGRSEVEHTVFSNREDLVAVMDAAGIERAVLVGASRAGSIALDTALEHPDRVAGLVWVCGGVSGLEVAGTPEEEAMVAASETAEEARDWATVADLDVALWIDGPGQPAGRAPAAVRDLVHRMAYETYVQEKVYGDHIELDPPAAARLGELGIPLLAIVGLFDESGPAAAAERLVVAVAGARRLDIATGHLPNLEAPAWFTGTLLGFVAGIEARPAS